MARKKTKPAKRTKRAKRVEQPTLPPTKLYLVKYDHAHGTDLNVFTSRESALECCIAIILEWIEDVRATDTRNQILALVADEKFQEALELWWEYQGEQAFPEELGIEEMSRDEAPQRELVTKAKRLIEEFAQEEAEEEPNPLRDQPISPMNPEH